MSSFQIRSCTGSKAATDANSLRNPIPRARAMSCTACWNTVVMKRRSQWRPHPAVWGNIHSPRAMGARASRMSMRARRSTICTMT